MVQNYCIFCLFSLIGFSSAINTTCPSSSETLRRLGDTRYYIEHGNERGGFVTQSEARQHCESHGLKLAKIRNMLSMAVVSRELEKLAYQHLLKDTWYWLDAVFDDKTQSYFWGTVEDQDVVTYSNFLYRPPRPTGIGAHITYMRQLKMGEPSFQCLTLALPWPWPYESLNKSGRIYGMQAIFDERHCDSQSARHAMCESEDSSCNSTEESPFAMSESQTEYFEEGNWIFGDRAYIVNWKHRTYEETEKYCDSLGLQVQLPGITEKLLIPYLKMWSRGVTMSQFWTSLKYNFDTRQFLDPDGTPVANHTVVAAKDVPPKQMGRSMKTAALVRNDTPESKGKPAQKGRSMPRVTTKKTTPTPKGSMRQSGRSMQKVTPTPKVKSTKIPKSGAKGKSTTKNPLAQSGRSFQKVTTSAPKGKSTKKTTPSSNGQSVKTTPVAKGIQKQSGRSMQNTTPTPKPKSAKKGSTTTKKPQAGRSMKKDTVVPKGQSMKKMSTTTRKPAGQSGRSLSKAKPTSTKPTKKVKTTTKSPKAQSGRSMKAEQSPKTLSTPKPKGKPTDKITPTSKKPLKQAGRSLQKVTPAPKAQPLKTTTLTPKSSKTTRKPTVKLVANKTVIISKDTSKQSGRSMKANSSVRKVRSLQKKTNVQKGRSMDNSTQTHERKERKHKSLSEVTPQPKKSIETKTTPATRKSKTTTTKQPQKTMSASAQKGRSMQTSNQARKGTPVPKGRSFQKETTPKTKSTTTTKPKPKTKNVPKGRSMQMASSTTPKPKLKPTSKSQSKSKLEPKGRSLQKETNSNSISTKKPMTKAKSSTKSPPVQKGRSMQKATSTQKPKQPSTGQKGRSLQKETPSKKGKPVQKGRTMPKGKSMSADKLYCVAMSYAYEFKEQMPCENPNDPACQWSFMNYIPGNCNNYHGAICQHKNQKPSISFPKMNPKNIAIALKEDSLTKDFGYKGNTKFIRSKYKQTFGNMFCPSGYQLLSSNNTEWSYRCSTKVDSEDVYEYDYQETYWIVEDDTLDIEETSKCSVSYVDPESKDRKTKEVPCTEWHFYLCEQTDSTEEAEENPNEKPMEWKDGVQARIYPEQGKPKAGYNTLGL